MDQLAAAVAEKKSKCSPGMNATPCLVYKKCPKILKFLLQIMKRAWRDRVIPVSWQRGCIILIPKSSTKDLSDPSEFRPIALLNAEGRLFFTLMEWRLSDYMVSNGYLVSTVQKGFMRDVAGCVEHSETVYRAALDARTHGRDLCMSWIDLANAYGSVKHSLIHFSLEWYHVPEHFCELMWRYYEGLMASVMVGDAQTAWFRFGIGVFQGCTISTVLFNAAFHTSFEHLTPLEEECGYQFRDQSRRMLRVLVTGYADDIGLLTGSRCGRDAFRNNELVLKRLQAWLEWTQSMKAKPKKCISSGLRHGEPFDPKLKVWSSGGEWFPKFMGDDHFKFLGKGLVKDISDSYAKMLVKQKFNSYTALIDGTLLSGIEKLWIWDNVAMSKVSWDFFIHDFPPSFVSKELQCIQTKYLKKWSGLAVRADPSVLYRPREDSGMGLKEVAIEHKKQRLIRRHQLATSRDPQVREIHGRFAAFQHRKKTNALRHQWLECVEMDELLAEVKTGKIKGTSSDGAGVGYGVRRKWSRPQDKHKGEREAMLHVFGEIAKENRLVKVMSKPLEGEQVSTVPLHGKPDEKRGNYFCGWLTWRNVVSLDLRWNRILQKQDSYLRFALNAVQDSLPTPSRLKHWQQDSAGDGLCPLGCRVTGSLLHILCQCQKAIKEEPQSRITWRHDSILLAIYKSVKDRIKEAMESRVETEVEDSIGFKSNLGKFTAPRAQSSQAPLLESADDWKVQFDVNDEGVSVKERPFPSEIAVVSGPGSRPDGVIWSMQTKTVIWIELTSPWEENLTKKHFEKMDKYNKLAIDLREGKHHGVKWTVVPLCVEVGARGAINEQPWNWMCKRLGFSKCSKRRLTQGVQDAAVACSYYIFLCRFLRTWEPQALVDTLERSEC